LTRIFQALWYRVEGANIVGVQTTVKHYIANEQETARAAQGNVSSVPSSMGDKTMHELYL
jgi:beta-glucosidase